MTKIAMMSTRWIWLPLFLMPTLAMTASNPLPNQPTQDRLTHNYAAELSLGGSSGSFVIPRDFVGFSYEYEMFRPDRKRLDQMPHLIHMTSLLGPDVSIRVGGTTSDMAKVGISDDQLAGLIGFVRQVSRSSPLFFGLNFRNDNPSMDVHDADRLVRALDHSVFFQIGNEPDLYGISLQAYIAQWKKLHDAVSAAVPGALFAGPDIALGTTWAEGFFTAMHDQIKVLTHHDYGQGTLQGSLKDIVIALSKPTLNELAQRCSAIANQSQGRLSVRMTEGGSINGPGNQSVANSLGGALWDLKALMVLAFNGWAGMNFHGDVVGTRPGGYLPLVNDGDFNFKPQATYYAMWLFSRLQGMRLVPVKTDLGKDRGMMLGALGEDGKVRVLLINLITDQPLSVFLRAPRPDARASELELTAPNVLSSALTINGQPIPINGDGFKPPERSLQHVAGGFQVSLPPASAALVQFE